MKNAQLWKRILHGGTKQFRSGKDHLAEAIVKAPIIVDGRPTLPETVEYGTCSGIAFPFPKFWLEGTLSTASDNDSAARWGCLVENEKTQTGWRVMMVAIIGNPKEQPMCPGGYRFACDESASMVASTREHIVDTDMARLNGFEETKDACRIIAGLACDTLTLLGCQNVFLEPRDSDAKDTRIATKRHGPSSTGYRYHVLTVRPAGSKPGTPGVEIGTMPRHVCRGHFSEYGPEYGKGLLFGKYAGRFFIPPHLKGKAENGIVEKDYRVIGG